MSVNIDLRYKTAKHKKLLDALMARIAPARQEIEADRKQDFQRHDELYDAYIRETDQDKIRKQRVDDGDPDYYTVVVPQSYAALLTAHTYWTSVFLTRSPVLQYTARHGEPQMKVQATEAIMDYQMMVGKMLGPMYQWFHDAPKYGYSVLYDCWEKDIIQMSRIEEREVTFFGIPAIPPRTKKTKVTEQHVRYLGNKVFNVHPAHFWPDWRVPLVDYQKGEFVARYVELSWNALVKGKAQGQYFNLDAVKNYQAHYTRDKFRDEGATVDLPAENTLTGMYDINSVDMQTGAEIIIELIPKDWELGKSEYPEKWVFTIIQDAIIIEARPFTRAHGEFPVTVLPMDQDAYSAYSKSILDRLKPMNDAVTWLMNQHFFAVRNSLGNNFIYDPSRVVTKDLTRRGTSKLIRLKESAYGTDIRSVISQLPVTDVTGNHMRDMEGVANIMQRIFGINDNLMGQVHPGGRKTATEVRTSSTFGVNRLKTTAEYWSAVGFTPLSQRLLLNTQQLYDREQQFKIAGGLATDAQFIDVNSSTLSGAFDFVPVDGTMPIDRYAQANLWKEIIFGASKIPQIGQKYDLGGMFAWMAQLSGMKNIKQFEIQIMPDGQVENEFDKGNMVRAQNLEGPTEPGQIPGMGATG